MKNTTQHPYNCKWAHSAYKGKQVNSITLSDATSCDKIWYTLLIYNQDWVILVAHRELIMRRCAKHLLVLGLLFCLIVSGRSYKSLVIADLKSMDIA